MNSELFEYTDQRNGKLYSSLEGVLKVLIPVILSKVEGWTWQNSNLLTMTAMLTDIATKFKGTFKTPPKKLKENEP